jgi:hypothetical protein
MNRRDVTEELSEKVEKKLRRQFSLVAQEVWVTPTTGSTSWHFLRASEDET